MLNFFLITAFCPLSCTGPGAQGEPKVLPGVVYGPGETTVLAPDHKHIVTQNIRHLLRAHLSPALLPLRLSNSSIWVSTSSCRRSQRRTCFVRVFCHASSALTKNTACLPPARSSAPWMRTTLTSMRETAVRTANAGKLTPWESCLCVYKRVSLS